MRMVTYTGAGGAVIVQAGDRTWTFGPGSRANLDEQVAPGQTLEQALGADLHLFTPDAPDAKAAPPSRRTPATAPLADDKGID